MKPAYVSLPSAAPDDCESKPLVESSDTQEIALSDNVAIKPSARGLIVLIYILCALTIFFASVNFLAVLDTAYHPKGLTTPIGQLPRPNIFAGLPKERVDVHVHAHEHSHTA